jgi:3'(2'), 5'-bisphosphate nucleotidase
MKEIGKELLEELVEAAREAGREILEVYSSGFEVSYKSDSSPVTTADRRSHELIKRRLAGLSPNIPFLSEEGRSIDYATRRGWREFYLIDPLDGTKEFIGRNGEFTVNIALIREARPLAGVIYVPVLDLTYYALKGHGAFVMKGEEAPRSIASGSGTGAGGLVVVASRSHATPELEGYLKRLKVRERVSRGSSLKFCLVAEGKADIYPRLGPTWEWDTAAGHAILEEAGGRVLDLGGRALAYNKESLKHEGFIALGRGVELP